MSGGEVDSRAKGSNVDVGTGGFGFGGDKNGDPGGGEDGVGRGDGRGRHCNGQLVKWEDTVVTINLQTYHNYPLAYDPVLELHHPIMSKIGEHGGQ